ncbi:PREDICTED: uncharacterized protein LOC108772247 [Cyphomyrmex costatus]|uniref:uncharacterized protein LOC108772247 n=1 Tax=Cyphomyrmex costatus TaxID=456900 RepID=UPI0008523FCF|nr:PREDICTED: uncharacterized protein LOC108772247 [Cyphomyrmex costatus]
MSDPGSELSFVTEELVNLLKLPRQSAAIPLLGIGSTFSGRTKGLVHVELYSMSNISDSCELRAFVLPRLTSEIPSFEVDNESWAHFRNLQLADPHFGKPSSIQMIIGADSYSKIIKPGLIKNESSSLVAQLTLFGWEEIPNSSSEILNPEDAKCEEYFRSTVSRDQNGRYIVRLPLKSPVSLLGDSSSTALRCLTRIQKRLMNEPSYCQLYVDFLHEYESLGHMIPVAESEAHISPSFYLPHHGVLRDSQTTKLRVVFNGSSPSSSGVSLNDILHSGAKLQSNIFDVLLFFRLNRYVFSSDICKMYRQILVHQSDQALQRIMWYDSNNQIRPYQLTTVTYGLNCAPFLALRVIQQLIVDEGHRFPKAISSLTKGRYVDDIFGGADSIEEAKEIINQVSQLCMAGGFPLQKWKSNCQDLLDFSWPPTDSTTAVELDSSRTKVLGLTWQPQSDMLKFTCMPSTSQSITKRSTLSDVAQLYDPAGLISPVVVQAKIFIQDLWLAKVDWDTPLSSELQNRWINFKQQLSALSKLDIPRWLYVSSNAVSIELHGFSDASLRAMAAVVYIRVETKDLGVRINLICAKTKVAPLKRLTVPRLELNAALILARLTSCVRNVLELNHSSIYLWTDSSVALTWITSHPAKWKEYVRNRVIAIHELVPTATWRFVPGKENPADCASRGISAHEIKQHSLWWQGPAWLSQAPNNWPQFNLSSPSNFDLEENCKHVCVSLRNNQILPWDLIDRYSSLTRLLRITATCKRAIKRFRRLNEEPISNPLTPFELQESCLFWIRLVQRIYFQSEIRILSRGEQLCKSNSLIKLMPFLDGEGLLRVGGRLQHASLDSDFKHPFILPRQSRLSTLIISDAHLRTLHGGTQVTLAHIRQKYWIVGGRVPVRSHILKCIKCARYRQNRAQQMMGQLPQLRVTPSRPFLNSGVDYAGPISIKTWRGRAAKIYKGYLVVFVCFSTSAVHLEVVTDYTTEAFIAAYKRFTARRGICATLHSDCGTNLVGADRELRQRFDQASQDLKELATRLADHGTKWHFIPPAAPHFGGKWEAAVKSSKFHLLRVIGDSILTYEELTTLMTQIEAVLNSRPLCPLTEDADDFAALTPGHFIMGEAPSVIPEPNLIDQPSSRLTRWQLIRQKLEHFWKRWQTEYLQRYQAISKWHHPNMEVKEGSLVLIVDERYPPAKWPLARVVQLHPGKDGLIRVVTVRTATSTFKRPIVKIFILPIEK